MQELQVDGAKPHVEAMILPLEQVHHYWEGIKACFEAQPEHLPFHNPEALLEGLEIGMYQLWASGPADRWDAVFITQVLNYPGARVLCVWWAYGKNLIEALPEADAAVEQWARKTGCEYIEVVGRRGWERVFAKRGFKFSRVTMRRPVGHERRQ